jgi:hypothetical protein
LTRNSRDAHNLEALTNRSARMSLEDRRGLIRCPSSRWWVYLSLLRRSGTFTLVSQCSISNVGKQHAFWQAVRNWVSSTGSDGQKETDYIHKWPSKSYESLGLEASKHSGARGDISSGSWKYLLSFSQGRGPRTSGVGHPVRYGWGIIIGLLFVSSVFHFFVRHSILFLNPTSPTSTKHVTLLTRTQEELKLFNSYGR